MSEEKRLKILMISTSPIGKDGITSVVYNIAENIDTTQFTIDIMAINEPEIEYENRIKQVGGEIHTIKRRSAGVINYAKMLKSLIQGNKYDIVHIHGNSHSTVWELLAAKLGGCSVRIVHAHSTHSDYPLFHKLLTPLFNCLCTCRLACGIESGKFMYGRKNFLVINNGVDSSRFAFNKNHREMIRNRLKLKNKKVLCHVGLFAPVKNHHFLLEIMAEMKKSGSDYKLLLIGTGAMMDEMKNKARSMNLDNDVIFIGATDAVEQYLSAADLFLMPSLYEGLPLSLIEAQANGIRCIVSEKVTSEVDKTGNLLFLPIDQGADCWVQAIKKHDFCVERESESEIAVSKIIKNGYSIHSEVKNLINYYKEVSNQTKYGGGT